MTRSGNGSGGGGKLAMATTLTTVGTAANVAEAPPLRPRPLTQDGLLGLFKSEVVGRNVVLEPATHEDMCGSSIIEKPSLEVVYDTV